jgi:hypothetical protein
MIELNEILGEDYIDNLTGFLIRIRTDFKFFCERVMTDLFKDGGVKPYMMEWFELVQSNPRVAILAPAGFAKTTILGVAYPIWLSFTQKNMQLMVVSNSMTQARRVLALIKSTIENNALLVELKPLNYRETWSSNHIKMSTGCAIFCRPYTITIKGERVDYIIMDEASSYQNVDIYFDYIIPRLNPHNGKICLISTPESGTDLMAIIAERKLDYIFKKYTAINSFGEALWPERFSLERLNLIREEQGEQFFQKNFMCNTRAEGSNSVFTAKSILECTNYELCYTSEILAGNINDAEIYMGCDFAIASGATADYDCYVIIERINDRAIIKFAEVKRYPSTEEKFFRISHLFEIYKPVLIIADQSSIGPSIISDLRNIGLPVQGYSFQSLSRNALLNNLKVLLDNKKIIIPKNKEDMQAVEFADKLEVELLSFREQHSQVTGHTAYVSTGAHDDSVMGLALAVSKIKQMQDFEDTIISSNDKKDETEGIIIRKL